MDSMTLIKSDGTEVEVEVILTFKIKEFNNKDYVIYKDNEKFYAASYSDDGESVSLDTDLSDEEKVALSDMFKKLKQGGVINA